MICGWNTISKSSQQGPLLLVLWCLRAPSTPLWMCQWLLGLMNSELASVHGSWASTSQPFWLTTRLTGSSLFFLRCSCFLLVTSRCWDHENLSPLQISLSEGTANWWFDVIFRMLSYSRRLKIEMSRGYTYGIYGSFKSEINCQVLIFNFFLLRKLVKGCQRKVRTQTHLTWCSAYSRIEPLTLPAVQFRSLRKSTAAENGWTTAI